MNRFFLKGFLLSAVFLGLFNLTADGGEKKAIVQIFYSGSQVGYLEPCG